MSASIKPNGQIPFVEGDLVTKVGGDYTFTGPVVACFLRLDGQTRYVCEDDRGILHIFGPKALRKIGQAFDLDIFRNKALDAVVRSAPVFNIGEFVEKVGGDYRWQGTVRCAFYKVAGQDRYIVENPDGILHVFGLKGLKRIDTLDKTHEELVENIFKDTTERSVLNEVSVIEASNKALGAWQEVFASMLNIPIETIKGEL